MYIIMAILGFSLLIIVHELGHFIMAKVNGIKVEEFSIGMGPEIFSKKGKETQYSLRLFPIGGYVKMLGEEEVSDDERSFSSKSPLRRITVILAGVTMNIIFAIVAFSIIISNRGYTEARISKLEPNTPAIESGLQVGDKILAIDGSRVFTTTDVSMGNQLSKGKTVDILVNIVTDTSIPLTKTMKTSTANMALIIYILLILLLRFLSNIFKVIFFTHEKFNAKCTITSNVTKMPNTSCICIPVILILVRQTNIIVIIMSTNILKYIFLLCACFILTYSLLYKH